MTPDSFQQIGDIKSIVFMIIISSARMSGFLIVFALIGFGLKRGAMVRIAASVAISLPILIGNIESLAYIFKVGSLVDRTFLPAKEAVIGLLIGVVASLPFYAFQYGGNLIDGLRGESSNGAQLVGSESGTVGSVIFFLALAMTFVFNDGFSLVIQYVYLSFLVWPIDAFLPVLRPGSVAVLVDLLHALFMLMIRVAFPFLVLLLAVEVFFVVAGRLAQRFSLGSFGFPIKNMSFLLLIPVYLSYLFYVSDDALEDIIGAPLRAEAFFE